MAQNINVRMPPFLPTVPLPVGMVGQGMMYMYSCSQCDFKTHVEAMFKQHVDSVHLGIPRYEKYDIELNRIQTNIFWSFYFWLNESLFSFPAIQHLTTLYCLQIVEFLGRPLEQP